MAEGLGKQLGTRQLEETSRPTFADNWCETVFEVTKTDFKWNIQFPFLEYPLPSIESSKFSSGEYCDWTLCLYGNKVYLDIYLNLKLNKNISTIAPAIQVLTGIANKKGDLLSTETVMLDPNNFFGSKSLKVSQFNKEELLKSKFYEKEGNWVIYCTVKFWTRKETKSGTSSSEITSDVFHSELVSTQFEELFKNKTLSDVNLNVGGRIFPAHKNIIAARSKVFAAMFNHETAENLSNQVDIQDIDPDVFQEVLRYLYTGRMSREKLDEMAVGVLAVADKYLLDELKAECENHLMKRMSADNCAELLAFAAQPHPAIHLKKYAVDFLLRFPAIVMATDGWKKAKKEKLLWWYESIEVLCSRKLLDV
uniref:Ring canal kelch protein n=1 Tax=Daphnia magna TaxID=35525 RepID=A0A0N8E6F6_9CRUS